MRNKLSHLFITINFTRAHKFTSIAIKILYSKTWLFSDSSIMRSRYTPNVNIRVRVYLIKD